MLAVVHPHGASTSEYASAPGVAAGSTNAVSNFCQFGSAHPQGSRQSLQFPAYPPSSAFLLQQQQVPVQPGGVLSVAVQDAARVVAPLCPGAGGVPAVPSCAPAVVRTSLSQQAPLQQAYLSMLPATVSSAFPASSCVVPSVGVVGSNAFAGLPAVSSDVSPGSLSTPFPQQALQCLPVLFAHPLQAATLQDAQASIRTLHKDRQRSLAAKDGDQHALAEALCEREDKHWSEFAITQERQREERHQRQRQQHPPLWRVPLVRDPLAAAAEDFNPVRVSEAALVRDLWKHARAAVADPASTPPFRWDAPQDEPPPSYWNDLWEQSQYERPDQHGQGRTTREYGRDIHLQSSSLAAGRLDETQIDFGDAGLREAAEVSSSPRARGRKASSTSGIRRSQKTGDDQWSERLAAGRDETAPPCHAGEEHTEPTAPVLTTRVGRSQSPRYSCPRRDDFTVEQATDAPAYNTNHWGLLSDTGMNYTKHYELPTLSRFLQAKHPVFLRARTSADARRQQSRLSSGDVLRARTARSSSHRKQRGRLGSKDIEAQAVIASGPISYVVPAIPPVATPAAIYLQPQTPEQAQPNQVIVPTAQAPTVTMSFSPTGPPVTFARPHHSPVIAAGAAGAVSTGKPAVAPLGTEAGEASLTSAAVPLCVVPQVATGSVPSRIQHSAESPESQQYSPAEGGDCAVTRRSVTLHTDAAAAAKQHNLAQVAVQSISPSKQVPQTTGLGGALTIAPSNLVVAGPAFGYVSPGRSEDAAKPNEGTASHASPRCSPKTLPAKGVSAPLEHSRGTPVSEQTTDEQSRQTAGETEDNTKGKYSTGRQQECGQQLTPTSEQPMRSNVGASQLPGRPGHQGEPLGAQESSQAYLSGQAPQQQSFSVHYPPYTYVMQQAPQGTSAPEASTYEPAMHSAYLFNTTQTHLLPQHLPVAVSPAPPSSLTTAMSVDGPTLALEEANPSAVVFHSTPARNGFTTVGGSTGAQSRFSPGSVAPYYIPITSAGTEAHPVAFISPENSAVCDSAAPIEMCATAPPDGRGERGTSEWRAPAYAVVAASPSTCLPPFEDSCTSAAAPTSSMLLRCHGGESLLPLRAWVGAGELVW